MQTEIEAKFLNVDHDAIRHKLLQLGAKRIMPMRTMYRNGYDFPDRSLAAKNGWARVRNEGNKITMSYKQLNDRSVSGTQEICLTVDSFEQADAFLRALGLKQTVHMATMRESWALAHIEIELDQWPWTKPYVEIEAHTEDELRLMAGRLGLDWSRVLHGSVEVVYMAEYDVTEADVNSWPEITFEPVPAWLESKRRPQV